MSKAFIWVLLLGGLALSMPIVATPAMETDSVDQNTDREEYSASPDNDPFQGLNRLMFSIHNVLDGTLMEPMANLYQDGVPTVVKNRLGSFLNNIREPWTLINDVLQGQDEKTLVTFSRFMINTVFGLFGLFDVAGKLGLEGHQSNFGQTLGAWGVPAGPYIFVPILGPHSLRSLFGRIAGLLFDPYNIILKNNHRNDMLWATIFVDGLVKRADSILVVNDLRENSLDYYIGMRSSWQQYEEGQVGSQESTLQPNPKDFLLD